MKDGSNVKSLKAENEKLAMLLSGMDMDTVHSVNAKSKAFRSVDQQAELDIDRAEDKKREIVTILSSQLQAFGVADNDCRQLAENITSASITVDPPVTETVRHTFDYVVMTAASGRGGGKSFKPGNVTLNFRTLIEAVANGTLAGATVVQIPWMAPFALLLLWNSLWKAVQIDLSDNEAATLYAMWVHRDRMDDEISGDGLLDKVNGHLIKYGRSSITQKDLNFALEKLLNIESIQKTEMNPGKYRLCERIDIEYR